MRFAISFAAILILCASGSLISQTTVLLTADYDVAIGYHDNYNTASTNYNNAVQNAAYVIPGTSGGLNVNRSMIHFNLSVIPAGATITLARINLYGIGPPQYTISHSGTNSSSYLQRITQPWGATTATWNNQPTSTPVNQVILPAHTIPMQDYTNVVVTQMVLDMVASGNHGFMLKLVNEVLSNGLIFGSLNCGNPQKFPTLEITYTLPAIAPPIHCLEVHGNGDVTLTWVPADIPSASFNSYHLWSATNPAGPFMPIDSIFNLNTVTTTHSGANAHLQSIWYMLKVRTSASAGNYMSAPYDTARTILLEVINTNPVAGIASLQWNPTHQPLLPGCSGVYEIWREYPAGNWQLIRSTTSHSATDTIVVCDETINYRIGIIDTLSNSPSGPVFCKSVSSVDGDHFEETTPPPPPVIQLLTIDTLSGAVWLSWNINPAEDTEGYIAYALSGGIFSPLDTIAGRWNTTWTDSSSNPCADTLAYTVQAFDSCGNGSMMSLPHNTLLLKVKQTNCIEENTLSWNPYINMQPALDGYEVFVSVNGAPYIALATLSPGTLSYTHSNLSMGSEYCYLIHAFDSSQLLISTSCIVCHEVSMPQPVDYIYIKTATVEDNNHVKVVLYADPTVPVTGYELYRSEDGVNFSLLASIPMSTAFETNYHDYTSKVHSQAYYYRATIIDLCGEVADTSNTARTIHLQINTDQRATINNLIWNDYEGFAGDPTSYSIWRRIDGALESAPLINLPAITGLFSDDVSGVMGSQGKFSYSIEAVEGGGNPYGLSAKSLSNEIEIQMDPRIYIPSGFSPDGPVAANQVFKPVGLFVPTSDYSFSVYNRYGQMLFTTNDFFAGWDGTYEGYPVPEGVYAYLVRARFESGQAFCNAGTVTLIRQK